MESDKALRFVAAQPNSGAYNLSAKDSDIYSWVLMNGDLFPSSSTNSGIGDESLSLDHPYENPPDFSAEPVGSYNARSNTVKTEASDSKAQDDNSEASVDLSKLTPEEKRQRRLAKNREIARNCRKRKRERFNQLEEEVTRLRKYTQQLEMKLNGKKGGKDREDMRRNEVKEMEKLMKDPGSEQVLSEKLKHYKDMYSDFGSKRKNAIKYHMDQLKSLLIPNQVSKMTLWSLQQDDDFYDEKNNQRTFGGGIWNMLCSTLELTAEQKRGLIDMRHGIRKQRRNVAECLRIMNELDDRVKKNFDHMATQMQTIMSLISPSQQAKFLLWIAKNQACMHMLNNLWKEEVTSKLKEEEKPESSSATLRINGSVENKVEDGDKVEVTVKPEDMAALLRKSASSS